MTNINNENIKKVNEYLKDKKNILIITHYNPDGDAVGSSLALYSFFKNKGFNVDVIVPNEYPKFLHWLPYNDKIIIFNSNKKLIKNKLKKANLLFFIDFNVLDRIQGMHSLIKQTNIPKILIDHHPEPENSFDITISSTVVSSTAELLYEFMTKLSGEESIDQSIAECLYTGIMTDTGSFSYNSSLPDTYYVVSKLLEKGIDKDKIYWNVYDNYSTDRMRLLGYCLNKKMKVIPEYATAYISISADELKSFNYRPGDSEGFVNFPLSIKGIVFSAIFIEREDHIKISFRSKGSFNANKFAENHFNGGGHKNAAGGYSEQTMDKARGKFVGLLAEYKDKLLNKRI
ncbi:MAG: bifunctional oligoribonuclease/PAP phosphatase NrnA [Bacteroidales bacterium]